MTKQQEEPVLSPRTRLHGTSQPKQGRYSDLSLLEISEMLKSGTLENAPIQSLINVINGILDENIEQKSGEIPDRVTYQLRKVVQEIERCISTQDEHIRIQHSLFKEREEKYQSKIKVLQTLVSGTNQEPQIEKTKVEEKKKAEQEVARLMKEEEDNEKIEQEVARFTKEEEDNKKIEQEVARFMKEEEDNEKTEQEVGRFMKEKEDNDRIIAKLNEDLEINTTLHEHNHLQLENRFKEIKKELEDKAMELDQKKKELYEKEKELNFLLVESEKMKKKLKEFSESNSQSSKKRVTSQNIFRFQSQALQDLRLSLDCIKNDIINAQRDWQRDCSSLAEQFRELAGTADICHMVLAENRRIYNELQELKGNIRVYCRIRPFLSRENRKISTVQYVGEDGELILANPSKQGKHGNRMFKFNKVFGPTASQEEVYLDTQPLIRSVLDGHSVCIFAYGQTGSGKTYTMSGPNSPTKETWGVNYRALNDLFHISETRRNTTLYELDVQMLEIYNEQVRDLLTNDGLQKRLEIRNNSQLNGLAVPDASIRSVGSTTDVLELMQHGQTNRAMSATALNDRSSRSHSVLTVHVRGTDIKTGACLHGCLHLIDLAGSERIDRAEVTGNRLKEAQHINKSLSALGDVISALSQKSSHIPYRNSKLTQLLQSSLGGHAKTLMFVQVNPDVESYPETLSTLKFAERASGVELGAARSNKDNKDAKESMEQVASLKDTITRKDDEIEQLYIIKEPRNQSIDSNGELQSNDTPSLTSYRRQNSLGQRTKEPSAHPRQLGVERGQISKLGERHNTMGPITKEGLALKKEIDHVSTSNDPDVPEVDRVSEPRKSRLQLRTSRSFQQRSKSTTTTQLKQELSKAPQSPRRTTTNQVGSPLARASNRRL